MSKVFGAAPEGNQAAFAECHWLKTRCFAEADHRRLQLLWVTVDVRYIYIIYACMLKGFRASSMPNALNTA